MKRMLAILLLICLLLIPCCPTAFAASSAQGSCGNNLSWEIDNSGVLTISGSGEMPDFSNSYKPPWDDCLYTKIVINEGVSSIGSSAFSGHLKATSAVIPSTITSIGVTSFFWSGITEINIPDGVTYIGKAAFNSSKIKKITLPKSIHEIDESAFYHCDDLESVCYEGSPNEWSKISIQGGNASLLNASRTYANQSEVRLDGFARINQYNGQFLDVATGSWYLENVKTAFEMGLMKGTSQTRFNPDGNITIAETLAIACRVHNIFYGGSEQFVQGNPWYQVYVDYAVQNGIIQRSQFYSYTIAATREHFATILASAVPAEALEPINVIEQIPDALQNEAWKNAVYRLYRAGILTGSDSAGTFHPNSYIRRSEASAIITRIADEGLRKEFSLKGNGNAQRQSGNSETSTVQKEQEKNTMYGNYPGVPDVASVAGGIIWNDYGAQKAYFSVDYTKYYKALEESGYTKKETYTEKYQNSQLLTQFGKVSIYSNGRYDVYTLEITDEKIGKEKILIISIDKKIKKPIISEMLSHLVSEINDFEDSSCIYKADINNYKYGNMDTIYGSPIYVRKAKVSSLQDLEYFLNAKYDVLYSPMEDLDLKITVSGTKLNISVHLDFSFVSTDLRTVIFPASFSFEGSYSQTQRQQTYDMLKEVMHEMYDDIKDCFPTSTVYGCVFESGYHYQYIKVGYHSDTAMSWSDETGSFQWYPERDTFTLY